MNPNLKQYGKRIVAAAGASIALGTTATNLTLDHLEDNQLAKLSSNTKQPLENSETLFSPEKLRQEYQKAQSLRTLNESIVGTRRQISKTAGFLIDFLPGLALSKTKNEPNYTFADLEKLGIPKGKLTPLVDLGAFDLPKFKAGQLNFTQLKEQQIQEIVIMEDRDPMFYLNYDQYTPNQVVPLNRHGQDTKEHPRDQWTMSDLKSLVENLHGQGIKVTIGFWANTGNHEQNPFIKRNWQNVKPLIPTADDMLPLSFVTDQQGTEMPFADYILQQYRKLHQDFGFDGLFLGDGLMGFRSFLDRGPYDSSSLAPAVTDFYRRLHQGVHQIDTNNTLWAYDCMGNGTQKVLKNGVDLVGITPYIDHYVFQSYGSDAWGEGYMNLNGYNINRDVQELESLPAELKSKTLYTAGLGDHVEGWAGTEQSIRAKQHALGDRAKGGTLGVWSTVPIWNLNK